jgi:hypothetical protein
MSMTAPMVPAVSPAAPLDQLLRHPAIWRGGARTEVAGNYLATGWEMLDKQLPGSGWPRGALTEVLSDACGSGEVSLFSPALKALSEQGRWIAWVGAPWVPFAPVLAARGLDLSRVLHVQPRDSEEGLWAAEQLLSCTQTGAVLLWAEQAEERRLRRLQLAAESNSALAILFRPASYALRSSPAALRLVVNATSRGSEVDVIKCRGRRPGRALLIA